MRIRKSNRYYSNKQEKQIAKAIGGKQQSNSGATDFAKGDVVTDEWLIEAKTKTIESKSMSIKREWLEKNEEEAFAMNKPYNALAFNFGEDTPNYYIIDEKTFKQLVQLLKEEE